MTSWPLVESLRPIELDFVGPMSPKEVLYEFEGPCIFTALAPHDVLVLAYLSEDLEDEQLLRFIVATTSEATIAAMKDGVVSVREALDRGSLWLVDLDYQYRPVQAFAVRADELPEDALPPAATMLWSELEPGLLVRLDGPEIRRGRIPASVFTQAAEIAGKALKPVFEWAARALRQDTGGRPPDWLRLLYSLPAQRFAYGSLEIAFRPVDLATEAQGMLPIAQPDVPTPEQIQQSGWQALREGLEWAVSDQTVPLEDGDDEKWLAILEAMRRLSPSSTGPVTSIDVWGRLVDRLDRPHALTRDSARKIRSALTELKKRHDVQLRVFSGRIRDLDLDKLTLILRDPAGAGGDVQLVLDDDHLLEIAREAHYQELEVSVGARSKDNKSWTVTEIEFARSE